MINKNILFSKVIKVEPNNPDPATLRRAGEVIHEGGIIIFPTDTVYGVGCNIFNQSSVRTIFRLKNRPTTKPLPVMVNSIDQLTEVINGKISSVAQELISRFWPGALTLILPAAKGVPSVVTGGTNTIGVRMPRCKLLLDLISLAHVPLIATSVNLSGETVPMEVSQIITKWRRKVDLILDGGDMKTAFSSTVLNLTVHPPHIVREEAIGAKQLYPYFAHI